MSVLAGINWNPKQEEWDVYTRVTYHHDPEAYEEAAVFREDSQADK